MKKLIILIAVLAIAGAGYYFISPLFNTVEVDDALPEGILLPTNDQASSEESVVEAPEKEDLMPSGLEKLSQEIQADFEMEMEKVAEKEVDDMNDDMPEQVIEEPTEPAQPRISLESVPVMPTIGHPASGQVKVLQTTSGSIIRYEDFETINGPRLHVYLANDLDAEDYVDLGPIKGTQGNINYEIPDNIDVSQYQYVMYWCVPFGVLFNYAEINP